METKEANINEKNRNKGIAYPVVWVIAIFLACCFFRLFEYFILRTDQSVIGEAFVHKLIGIGVLIAVAFWLKITRVDIGLSANIIFRDILIGFLLAAVSFFIAYGVEWVIQLQKGNAPTLQFFATSYGLQENRILRSGLVLVLICIVGNVINVIMEEGVFRGLFVEMLERKYTL